MAKALSDRFGTYRVCKIDAWEMWEEFGGMNLYKNTLLALIVVTTLSANAVALSPVANNLCQIDGGQDVTTTQCDNPAGGQVCGGSFYKDIVFAQPFSAPPHVVVSPNHMSDGQVSPCAGSATDTELCYPANITTTGFRLYCSGSPIGAGCGSSYDGYLTSATASWLAYDSRPVCDATSGHSIVPTTCPGTFVGGLCSSVYQTNQTFSSPLPGAPKILTVPEHFSEQAGCVGYSTDFYFTQGSNISKTGFTLSAGGSPRASCGSYEGWISYAKAGFFGVYDRASCPVSSEQMVETDTCPGALSNGTCTVPFRKTITFSKTFVTPPKVFVTLQHASSNPPCAEGATDTILCRVVPGSVTTTSAVVQCSGSPEGPGCGSVQDGYFTKARFGYVAVASNCAVSQCKDGLDNDADGLIDLADPGCAGNPDGENEANGTTQCQDTADNDADGLIDSRDPGCSSPQDNDESDESTTLSVTAECVVNNIDNTKTAYFTYNNQTASELSLSTNATAGTMNEFVTTTAVQPPPSLFKKGVARGGAAVTFSGASVTWKVRAPGSALSQATVSATTPICAPITPKAECRSFVNGELKTRFSYTNSNAFELQFPVGTLNSFSPGNQNRGQPTRFFSGSASQTFDVTVTNDKEILTWNLNGLTTAGDSNLPICDGGCVDVPTGTIKGELDKIAKDLSDLMNKATKVLSSSKATVEVRADVRDRTDLERAQRKARMYEQEAKTLTLQIPDVAKNCPQAPLYCSTVDRGATIDALARLYGYQRNSIQRTIARSYFRNTGDTSRTDSLVRKAKSLEKQGLAQLAKLPRVITECK